VSSSSHPIKWELVSLLLCCCSCCFAVAVAVTVVIAVDVDVDVVSIIIIINLTPFKLKAIRVSYKSLKLGKTLLFA